MKRRTVIAVVILAGLAAGLYFAAMRGSRQLVLTGIVTTDQVIVSPEIQGRLQRLLVKEGDTVTNGQLLAVIQAQEWTADVAYFSNSQLESKAQVTRAAADLKYLEAQTSNQIRQAEATLASTEAQVVQAKAELEIAQLNFKREEDLFQRKVDSPQAYDQSRTSFDAAKARVASMDKQVVAAEAAVEVTRASQDQIAARRAAWEASQHQSAAAGAQREKAKVRLDYTEIHAPINGIVDVRAALTGEVVNPAQAVVTLIDPDDLWIRADVEESYIDRIRLGEKLPIRLPSGVQREGTVFYRRVDADYATQRDVSRTKRDIRTFEIRLRCDNQDRALAVGMTAYVVMPLAQGAEKTASAKGTQ